MKSIFFYLSLFMITFACTQEEVSVPVSKNLLQQTKTISPINNSISVSINDIPHISRNFWKEQNFLSKSSDNVEKNIQEVIPLMNNSGTDTIAYVANYVNGEGFLIVSATRNYYPILAYAETGKFSSDIIKSIGTEVLFSEYEYAMNKNRDTNVFFNYWDKLQSISLNDLSSFNDIKAGDDYFQYVEQCIGEWKSDGFDVYNITNNPGLPSDIYQDWYNKAVDRTASNENNISIKAFILKKNTFNEDSSKKALISTFWNQGDPYNRLCPEEDGERTLAGCGAIAGCQIMKYHQWPSKYNWDAMSNIETANTDWIHSATLIFNFAKDAKTDFGLGGSSTYISDIRSALVSDKWGYSSDAKIIDHSFNDIQYTLNVYGPVYMRGSNSDSSGHAWVCDGYKTEYYGVDYVLIVFPSSVYLFNEQEGSHHVNTVSYNYCHMNWGWGGSSNGWYLDNSLTDYQYKRQDIILIHK